MKRGRVYFCGSFFRHADQESVIRFKRVIIIKMRLFDVCRVSLNFDYYVTTNKNQHFVPRCYLRQFAPGRSDKIINLYNIERDRFIEGAPIKSQCSGDYFYGKDPTLEEGIQMVEGAYSSAVKE